MKIKNKKSFILGLISNIIICVCIFSVFELCFSGVIQTSGAVTQAIYHGNKQNKNATLMINVYWGTEYIDSMLDVLDSYNIKTTFFVGGYWVQQNEDMLNKIIEKGHEIGNHGYYHKDQDKLSYNQNLEEISMNHRLVQSLCNYEMKLFAPPSGAFNNNTLNASYDLGYKTIMWTKDTIDWRDKNSDLIYKRATKNMSNGDLILMHPTEHTVKALENIILTYQNAGFKLTTVSENIC